jgi:hypothetical protein
MQILELPCLSCSCWLWPYWSTRRQKFPPTTWHSLHGNKSVRLLYFFRLNDWDLFSSTESMLEKFFVYYSWFFFVLFLLLLKLQGSSDNNTSSTTRPQGQRSKRNIHPNNKKVKEKGITTQNHEEDIYVNFLNL